MVIKKAFKGNNTRADIIDRAQEIETTHHFTVTLKEKTEDKMKEEVYVRDIDPLIIVSRKHTPQRSNAER